MTNLESLDLSSNNDLNPEISPELSNWSMRKISRKLEYFQIWVKLWPENLGFRSNLEEKDPCILNEYPPNVLCANILNGRKSDYKDPQPSKN